MTELIRAFLVVGGVSVASAWTWPGAFPEADPVAVLVRYHTPNAYRAAVAWYYVAPGVAVFLAGRATWLDSYSLAYTVASLLNQLFGKGKEPFWQQAYTNLVRWIIECTACCPADG